MYKKTTEELLKVLDSRIADHKAQIAALEACTINTKHKTLTNRAIDGPGARIGDYLGDKKALYISYQFNTGDHMKYDSITLNAYTYQDADGNEIGSNDGLRISRTLTPLELAGEVKRLTELRRKELALLEADAKNAAKLVREYNAIADKVTAFEDKLTWASRSVLRVS